MSSLDIIQNPGPLDRLLEARRRGMSLLQSRWLEGHGMGQGLWGKVENSAVGAGHWGPMQASFNLKVANEEMRKRGN